jgi:hypothetical protein
LIARRTIFSTTIILFDAKRSAGQIIADLRGTTAPDRN